MVIRTAAHAAEKIKMRARVGQITSATQVITAHLRARLDSRSSATTASRSWRRAAVSKRTSSNQSRLLKPP